MKKRSYDDLSALVLKLEAPSFIMLWSFFFVPATLLHRVTNGQVKRLFLFQDFTNSNDRTKLKKLFTEFVSRWSCEKKISPVRQALRTWSTIFSRRFTVLYRLYKMYGMQNSLLVDDLVDGKGATVVALSYFRKCNLFETLLMNVSFGDDSSTFDRRRN